ncbi:hypothetical protein [Ralstonia solanacearum]|uniref:hypothetical protein n=1 Tax=Ralstonia solanacearum TaxID=305 RepID=UPI0013012E3E|nr:hypothetical protein [Ralstonia solanacearum]
MMPPFKLLESILKWIFGSPWTTSGFLALLGTASAWFLLRTGESFSWSRLAIGTVFGEFLGALFSVEIHFSWAARIKLMASGLAGILFGGMVAILLQLGIAHMIFAVLAGFVLGVTSRYWIFHVNLP